MKLDIKRSVKCVWGGLYRILAGRWKRGGMY